MSHKLPKLYAILDAETCHRRGLNLLAVAEAWQQSGIQLLQYRDKQATDEEVLTNAQALRKIFRGTLILNDRAHLFAQTGFHGLHIGQTDTAIAEARAIIGPEAILGISTHNPQQLRHADQQPVDYVAIGPIYATQTKTDADPVVGLEGVRTARSLTTKPLVAIGGITAATAEEVLSAGADSIAIISALLPSPGENLRQAAKRFL